MYRGGQQVMTNLIMWNVLFHVQIHQKQPKTDPHNYRRLLLIDSLYKLLTAILNMRIASFYLENGILSEAE